MRVPFNRSQHFIRRHNIKVFTLKLGSSSSIKPGAVGADTGISARLASIASRRSSSSGSTTSEPSKYRPDKAGWEPIKVAPLDFGCPSSRDSAIARCKSASYWSARTDRLAGIAGVVGSFLQRRLSARMMVICRGGRYEFRLTCLDCHEYPFESTVRRLGHPGRSPNAAEAWPCSNKPDRTRGRNFCSDVFGW
jgi:hypothetical protein